MMTKSHVPLPRRFAVALTEDAHARLRALNARHGLGNNYILTVLLERLDDYAHPVKLAMAFRDFIATHGAPAGRTGAR